MSKNVSKTESTVSLGEGPHEKDGRRHHHRPEDRRKMSDLSQGPGLFDMVTGDDGDDEHDKLAARSSSIIKFYPDWCRRCACNESPLRKDASHWELIKDFFSFPPRGLLGRLILISLITVMFWGFFYYLLRSTSEEFDPKTYKMKHFNKDLNPAWIKGPIFALGVILISGLACGVMMKRYLNLPPLLAPLLLGIIYNNVDALNLFHLMKSFEFRDCGSKLISSTMGRERCERLALHSVNRWIKPIRIIALAIILTRAGLELSPKQLRKLKGIVPLLAFTPCLVEATVCTAACYGFFNVLVPQENMKMSIFMCAVAGFAIAAVSPAVVVPGALSLKKNGYGVVKGVPTLLIAASSIDDVLAISCYSIFLGFAIKSPETKGWQTFSGGAIGLGVGTVHGTLIGILLHFIPPRNSKNKAEHRLLLLILINICSVMAYEETFYSSAGSISVLVTSFIAGFGWRSQPHWKRPMKKIEKWLACVWVLWVPLLFGTIGKEINLRASGFEGITLLKTLAVIGLSVTFRLIAAFLVVLFGTKFNCKECLFVALSWIPKATVQAALAPLVLTRAAEVEDGPNTKYLRQHASLVVNVAILAVLITAPMGSVFIAFTGPKLLDQNKEPEIIQEVESEFPNGGGIDPAESTYQLLELQTRQLTKKKSELDDDFARMEAGSSIPNEDTTNSTAISTK